MVLDRHPLFVHPPPPTLKIRALDLLSAGGQGPPRPRMVAVEKLDHVFQLHLLRLNSAHPGQTLKDFCSSTYRALTEI